MSMEKAYASSGKIFEQVSKLKSPGLYEQLKSIQPGEILVVKGVHDHVETILPKLKPTIPYELISPGDVADRLKSQSGARVMLVNCMMYNGSGESVPKKSIEAFVESGGRLVTTDWALSYVNHVFPKRFNKTKETNNDVVEVSCATDTARKLLGLNYSQCHPKWWLEGLSHIFDIGQGVVPLLTSEEQKEKYGQPYVAAGFVFGKGEAIHFISHLELQQTHLRSDYDKKGLSEFLDKIGAEKTPDLDDDVKMAELEAAYSTMNTLAHLCAKSPLLLSPGMKSVLLSKSVKSGKSSKSFATP